MNNFYLQNWYLKALLVILMASPLGLSAQTVLISGEVKSQAFDLPIVGAKIFAKGKVVGQTNRTGKFSINVAKGQQIYAAATGYLTGKATASKTKGFVIYLKDNPLGADSTYQTLYTGAQRRKLSTAAVSEIYSPELELNISRSTGGLLIGRIPGLYTSQATGEPGADAVSMSLRGATPFVMIDGTPQSFGAINPEQIESITLLKDAVSTAMLGMRASDGVLYITTKKGREEAQRISFKAQTGTQTPLMLPRGLDAYSYATLYNEALANDNKSPLYSLEALAAYRDKWDPISYPDVNWYDQVLKKNAVYSRYDLSVSGGAKSSNYFVNLDYLDQGGLFKTDPKNTYNTNADFKRYSFRSNASIDLTSILTSSVNLGAQIQNGNEPGAATNNIFSNLLTTPANAVPLMNPNGSLAGTDNYTSNILGQTFKSGYTQYNQVEFKVDVDLKAKLDVLTKGLFAKGLIAYNSYLFETISRTKREEVFEMLVNAAGDTTYTRRGPLLATMSNSSTVNGRNSSMYGELALGYNRTFGVHGVSAYLNASNDNMSVGSLLPENYRGIAAKTSYNYKEKYLVDLAFGYNGVERFAEGRRYGFFPAAGLGWNVAEEDFMKSVKFVNQLKLRGSYGLTGNVSAGRFTYFQYYTTGSGYNFGTTPTGANAIVQGALANTNVTWEKARKLNIGLDAAFLENKLTFTFDYFVNNFYDLLQRPNTGSSILGASYPAVNIGKLERNGMEFQLTYQDNVGKFNYYLQPNVSYFRSINTFIDEAPREYPWQVRTGMPGGQPYGYIAEGLFQSKAEASSSPVIAGYTARAGDIKYRDLNGDGVIDSRDVGPIGHQRPLTFYGLNFGFDVHGFDFSALVQGVENRQFFFTGANSYEFRNNGKAQIFEHHLDRWTPENAAEATYPRLTIGTNANNHVNSSYWLKSGDYIRLRTVELGYTLPARISKKAGLATARVFFNGSNLLTIAEFKTVEPETNQGGYPIPRTLSAGVNVKF